MGILNLLKRISSLVVIASMAFSTTVFAEKGDVISDNATEIPFYYPFEQNTSEYGIETYAERTLTENEISAINAMVSAVSNLEESVDITNYEIEIISEDDEKAFFGAFYAKLQDEHPEVFYLKSLGYSQYTTGKLAKVNFKFSMTESEIERENAMIEQEYRYITSLIPDNATDLEKALIVHDYIISAYEYDLTYTIRELNDTVRYKKCVCQGYTYLYMYVMNKLGIECTTVPSDALAHIWNKIKINGNWYNIDLTSDDPVYNKASNIRHDCFLVSDSELKDVSPTNHSVWNSADWDGSAVIVADDNTYSNAIFRNFGVISTVDNKLYSFDSDKYLCEINLANNTSTPVYTDSENYIWYQYGSNSSYYPKMKSCAIAFNGKLYFNSPNAVYEFDTISKTATKIFDYNGNSDISKTYFYGLVVKNNGLYAEYSTNAASNIEDYITIIEPKTYTSVINNNNDGTYKVSVMQNKNCAENCKVLIAEYDENSKLLKFTETDVSEITDITPYSDTDKISVFIWSLSMKPFDYVNSIKISN